MNKLLPQYASIANLETRPQIYLLVDEYDALSNDYLEPYGAAWDGTKVERTFKSFWAQVKPLLGSTKGIPRAFITGISPLSLTDIGSGFNVAMNRSMMKALAELCGLTRADIEAALKRICGDDDEACKMHLSVMTRFFNGYYFCRRDDKIETMYNTDTCLSYLQVRVLLDYVPVSVADDK